MDAPLWKKCLDRLETELPEQQFNTWIRPLRAEESAIGLQLIAPNRFVKEWVREKYFERIRQLVSEVSGGRIVTVELETLRQDSLQRAPLPVEAAQSIATVARVAADEVAVAPVPVAAPAPRKADVTPGQTNFLIEGYTFQSFVEGKSNQLARAAAQQVAQNPGGAYNPLFIYGGVGLGKTHRVQAIGNAVTRELPDLKVDYVTVEAFANEFIQSIQKKAGHQFKNRYRGVDVLLIDDVHFIEGKEGTQEELFHTFNALYDANKQMVFTSDRPVSEIRSLSDRLRSRFERGLNVDLKPPDYETRKAILNRKIEEKRIGIPDEVVTLICRNITTNIRDLEKALTKLMAYSELVNKTITLEVAQQQLKDFFPQMGGKNITIEGIQRIVAEYFGLTHKDLRGKRRTKAVAFPRQVAMYLIRNSLELSFPEIGKIFSKHHSTVMYAVDAVHKMRQSNPDFDASLTSFREHFG